LGQPFLDEYRKIYTERIAAKRAGDKVTMDTLRIALNGTFGKLASRWSVLYAPDLMLAVTLTGQFTLLMLIEQLETVGASILSANTDGIAIGCSKAVFPAVEQTVADFTALSGYHFEYTHYRVLAMKDVNNYFAVKADRSLKAKGIYAPLSLSKNTSAQVCADAVGQWLSRGTPLLETIKSAGFTGFLSARNVTGGGQQCGEYLGKVVRWYQSTDKTLEPLKYVKNGNKVPKTDGARACMRIDPEGQHPADLDYNWYLCEALRIAKAVGCERFLSEGELRMITPVKPERKKNVTRK
jgi:ribosomal protein S16